MISQDQTDLVASVIDDLAAGRQPACADLVAAALTMDTLVRTLPGLEREILDAGAGLELAATGRLDLDHVGRARAAVLAQHVRALQP